MYRGLKVTENVWKKHCHAVLSSLIARHVGSCVIGVCVCVVQRLSSSQCADDCSITSDRTSQTTLNSQYKPSSSSSLSAMSHVYLRHDGDDVSSSSSSSAALPVSASSDVTLSDDDTDTLHQLDVTQRLVMKQVSRSASLCNLTCLSSS